MTHDPLATTRPDDECVHPLLAIGAPDGDRVIYCPNCGLAWKHDRAPRRVSLYGYLYVRMHALPSPGLAAMVRLHGDLVAARVALEQAHETLCAAVPMGWIVDADLDAAQAWERGAQEALQAIGAALGLTPAPDAASPGHDDG